MNILNPFNIFFMEKKFMPSSTFCGESLKTKSALFFLNSKMIENFGLEPQEQTGRERTLPHITSWDTSKTAFRLLESNEVREKSHAHWEYTID